MNRMTLEEKAELTAGTQKSADGTKMVVTTVSGDQKTQLPQLKIPHGPYGFRGRYQLDDGKNISKHGTAFPA